MFSLTEKKYLLSLARASLDYYFKTGKVLEPEALIIPLSLKAKQGVFVSLKKHGELRGCIGYLEGARPVYQAVIDNALSAAFKDNRFLPVTGDELKNLTIEISILSTPQELKEIDSASRLRKLRPLLDGVVLKQGNRGATYLPQVWEELPQPQEFLSSLCLKAGLKEDCWQDMETKLFTYQAEVFKEDIL